MLVKTDKEVLPVEMLPCPMCGTASAWIGVAPVDLDDELWRDIYWCPECRTDFYNEKQGLWCDPATDNFYAYQESAHAS